MKSSVAGTIHTLIQSCSVEGIKIGKIVDIDAKGNVQVDFPGNCHMPQTARLTYAVRNHLKKIKSGKWPPVLLVFEEKDPRKPIILDILVNNSEQIDERQAVRGDVENLDDVTINGQTVQFNAQAQIVLKCGKACITLTKAGKVLIRGAYLLSRSTGINRLKGGSIQIN